MALSISRPRQRSLTNPSLIHLFSTSSSSQNDTNSHSSPPPHQQRQEDQELSSVFGDIKASLKQQHRHPQSQPNYNKPSNSKATAPPASVEDIRKTLSEFRRRSAVPLPTELVSSSSSNTTSPQQSSGRQQVSFQELYRNITAKSENNDGSGFRGGTKTNKTAPGLSFDAIKESLRKMRSSSNTNANIRGSRTNGPGNAMSSGFMNSLKFSKEGESMKSSLMGGTDGLPLPALGKDQGNVQGGISTEFMKTYSYEELGKKLRSLRPEEEEREKGGFSLEELNERLGKLKDLENKEAESKLPGHMYKDLRDSLHVLKLNEDVQKKSQTVQRLNFMSQLSTSPNYMLYPPKEELVEKYFHPDNMSSAEKLKIVLSKVREEFKMSESDCGSARVQVAQLTTRIKHLSSVLHKKDKHSRKGLQEMVQRRKQLLKYLRRTDWDSYCFVLSKLGLRDNPDFKYLARN